MIKNKGHMGKTVIFESKDDHELFLSQLKFSKVILDFKLSKFSM